MTSWLLDRRNVLVVLPWITGPRLWLAYGAWLGRMTNHVLERLAVTSLVGRQQRQVEIKKTGNFNANQAVYELSSTGEHGFLCAIPWVDSTVCLT